MVSIIQLATRLSDLPNCQVFLDAWHGWRGDNVLPLRGDVRPEDLRATMSTITILEMITPEQVIIRKYASNMIDRTGQDMKGVNIMEIANPDHRQKRLERYQNLATTPCGMLGIQPVRLADNSLLDVILLILPVAKALGGDPKFFYVAEKITDNREWHEPSNVVATPTAKNMEYIDIGCGVPDET